MRGFIPRLQEDRKTPLTIPQLMNPLFILYWSCHGPLTQQTDCFICERVCANEPGAAGFITKQVIYSDSVGEMTAI